MPVNKRYLIAHRYNPRPDSKFLSILEEFVNRNPGTRIVRRTPAGRHVIEMTDQQMRDLEERNPQFVIESDQELNLIGMPGLPPVTDSQGNDALNIVVKDAHTGEPVPDATVYGLGCGLAYRTHTDINGLSVLEHSGQRLKMLVVSPRATYWSRIVKDFDSQKTVEVRLKPLLSTGAYNWGHRLMGFEGVKQAWTGKGIRVAVVDSGISDHLQTLHPAGGINVLVGQDPDAWNRDERGHGTHSAGIIGASDDARGITGGAPEAQVFSVKVGPGGFVSDLVQAIEWCALNRMEVVNIGVESVESSLILAHAFRDAYERGITCIAAAGNQHASTSFPAAYPTVLGIGAIGRVATFPEDSAHQLKVSRMMDRRGRLFTANFTNTGTGVDFCAPGVAMLSTVPSGYACWDGTSSACSLVTALVALVLEAYPAIRTGQATQVEYVRSILNCASMPLGMPAYVQGRGLPLAAPALGAAGAFQRRM